MSELIQKRIADVGLELWRSRFGLLDPNDKNAKG